jgi:hypothetical protein
MFFLIKRLRNTWLSSMRLSHRSRSKYAAFSRVDIIGLIGVITLLGLTSSSVWADAVITNRAMSAVTIAQYYVEEDGIRVDLEIGLAEIEAFQNLVPDELYHEMTGERRPLAERLVEFFTQDFAVLADEGNPLPGLVLAMEPRTRIRRDEISGEPLPSGSEEEETVIFAQLFYPFGELPRTITIRKRGFASIGYVVYHGGIAVNDFRYLAQAQVLTLDWEDPWYSRFKSRTLRRTYFAAMSGFLYIEPYEVRKEIIVRPKDLQEWVDLGLEGRDSIPVDIQAELKRRAGEFLRDRQKVIIDGVAVEPELARVNFLERTLTASRVIDPPTELDINAATLGVIFVYRTVEPLPQKVTLTWDMFSDKIPLVSAAAVDQAGSLPTYLEPDFAVLEWENFLNFPKLPTLKAVTPPPSLIENIMLTMRWALLALTGWVVWRIWRLHKSSSGLGLPSVVGALVLAMLTASGFWVGERARLSDAEANSVVASLLHNVYRAFDFRAEEDIYDVLNKSVSGELLADIYLDTRRGLELENQGGARAKVKQIDLETVTARPSEDGGFLADATWVVTGSVGHWGHLHQRRNKYQAKLDIRPVDGAWKLVDMEVLQEERL